MTTKITNITVARLYNLGNFENMKYEVQVIVEDGNVDGAFSMARSTIEAQHARFEQERQEARRREREEAEQRQKEREAQWARERAERMAQQADDEEDGDPFEDEDEEDL